MGPARRGLIFKFALKLSFGFPGLLPDWVYSMLDGCFDPRWINARGCPICEDSTDGKRDLAYAQGEWNLVECGTCRFTYGIRATDSPRKSNAGAGAQMRRQPAMLRLIAAKAWWRPLRLHTTEPHEILNELGPEFGNVVDISCHDKYLFSISSRFSVYGFETFSTLSVAGRNEAAQLGVTILRVSAVDGLSRFADRSLAGAVVHGHLERDTQARIVMELLGQKLQFDGIAVLMLPNHGSLSRWILGRRWYKFRFPEQVNYFRKRDIAVLAMRFGLEASFPFRPSFPIDDNFIAILKRKKQMEIY